MRPKFGCNWLSQVQNEVFYHFLKFRSLLLLELAYSDSLQQCLTFSGVKTYTQKKFSGPNLGQAKSGPKSGPKLGFCHFLKFVSLVFLEIAYNDSLQQCLVEVKLTKKNLGPQIWAKIGLKIR